MNLLVILGYFLIYGTVFIWMPVVVIVVNYIDSRWDLVRAYDFKAKWFRRLIFPGLFPIWPIVFFIGLLLTRGGLASPW